MGPKPVFQSLNQQIMDFYVLIERVTLQRFSGGWMQIKHQMGR
jgi:hypothetical protein